MYIDTTYANWSTPLFSKKKFLRLCYDKENINIWHRIFAGVYKCIQYREGAVLLKITKLLTARFMLTKRNTIFCFHVSLMIKLIGVFYDRWEIYFYSLRQNGVVRWALAIFSTKLRQHEQFVNSTKSVHERIAPKRILGFIPSGWADGSNYNKKNASKRSWSMAWNAVLIIPYSEHSNYNEILEYLTFMKPTKIIPTVYKDRNDRRRIEKLFRNVTNRTDAKRKFINAFFGAHNGKKAKHVKKDLIH